MARGETLRVLYVSHSLPPHEYSGAPLIAQDYATRLSADGYDVAVMFSRWDDPEHQSVRRTTDASGFERFEVPADTVTWSNWSIRADVVAEARGRSLRWPTQAVLDAFDPDVIHVVDEVNLPAEMHDVFRASRAKHIRHVWNLEDLCGLISPVNGADPSNPLCPSPITIDQCSDCCTRAALAHGLADSAAAADVRAEYRQALLVKRDKATQRFGEYDKVVFAAHSFRTDFERTLPLDPDRVVEIPAGVANPAPPSSRPARSPGTQLTFVLAGTVGPRKGAFVLARALKTDQLRHRSDLRVLLLGDAEVDVQQLFAGDERIDHRGPYQPDGLPELLMEADVALAPSLFETFHRVTREYLSGGLPVIGSTAFGIPDIIETGRNGVILPATEPEVLAAAMTRVLDDRDWLQQLIQGARSTPLRSIDDEMSDLKALYAQVVRDRRMEALP